MEETGKQRQATDESSNGSREEPTAEAAVRAVARLLANPRRTRRD
ncbi:hypothetical protein [Blastococcus capsensis]|nr:hypothetical protein [Blastococcus capsensis]MDK3255499.1 hypothetical protein [Blastococcus capsensis]